MAVFPVQASPAPSEWLSHQVRCLARVNKTRFRLRTWSTYRSSGTRCIAVDLHQQKLPGSQEPRFLGRLLERSPSVRWRSVRYPNIAVWRMGTGEERRSPGIPDRTPWSIICARLCPRGSRARSREAYLKGGLSPRSPRLPQYPLALVSACQPRRFLLCTKPLTLWLTLLVQEVAPRMMVIRNVVYHTVRSSA